MKITENTVVTLEYKVYDTNTKEILENTQELGPYFYIQGFGQFLPKVEAALDGKTKGYKTTVEVKMDEAYGAYDEDLVEELTKKDFEEFDDIYEGMEFVVELEDGTEMISIITEIEGDTVYTDSNHPFCGRDLTFEVEVTDVREATAEELDHGHVHFHGFNDEEDETEEEHEHSHEGCCHGHSHGDKEHSHKHGDGNCCCHKHDKE